MGYELNILFHFIIPHSGGSTALTDHRVRRKRIN
jgi:hypothetical protein